jgi:hypothetical protein
LNEVSLAAAGVAINKKWIVGAAWLFDNSLSRSVSKLIEWTNHE